MYVTVIQHRPILTHAACQIVRLLLRRLSVCPSARHKPVFHSLQLRTRNNRHVIVRHQTPGEIPMAFSQQSHQIYVQQEKFEAFHK